MCCTVLNQGFVDYWKGRLLRCNSSVQHEKMINIKQSYSSFVCLCKHDFLCSLPQKGSDFFSNLQMATWQNTSCKRLLLIVNTLRNIRGTEAGFLRKTDMWKFLRQNNLKSGVSDKLL